MGTETKGKKSRTAPNRPELLARFGKWLEDARRAKRSRVIDEPLTQVEVARLAGISRVNYSSIENGNAGVSYEMVQRVARALQLDEHEALIRAGFNPGIMEEMLPLCLKLIQLPEEAQKMIAVSMLAQIEAIRELFPNKEKR